MPTMETTFPASVSIANLLKAKKLVKQSTKSKVKSTFEKFDVQMQEWQDVGDQEVFIETEKGGSGAFRDALKATGTIRGVQQQWVVKTLQPQSSGCNCGETKFHN